MTCTFFFYNNLTHNFYLDMIEKNYRKMLGYIEITYVSEDRSKIVLGNGKRLEGNLVFFNEALFKILNKINSINSIRTYKKKYKIRQIDVYGDDKIYEAYIIF